jgi:hypothetical protein
MMGKSLYCSSLSIFGFPEVRGHLEWGRWPEYLRYNGKWRWERGKVIGTHTSTSAINFPVYLLNASRIVWIVNNKRRIRRLSAECAVNSICTIYVKTWLYVRHASMHTCLCIPISFKGRNHLQIQGKWKILMLFLNQNRRSFEWLMMGYTWFSCTLGFPVSWVSSPICWKCRLNASTVSVNGFIHFPVHNVRHTA